MGYKWLSCKWFFKDRMNKLWCLKYKQNTVILSSHYLEISVQESVDIIVVKGGINLYM